jgi:restriction system protein
MPVPDYETFMLPMLRSLADGAEHHVRDIREKLAAEFKLTSADRAEMLPSGRQSVFDNRVGWAKTYMDKAGLIATVKRGVYRITDAGRGVLAERPASIDKKYLEKFEPFRAFIALQRDRDEGEKHEPVNGGSATPEEQLEAAYLKISQKTEAEVLAAVIAGSAEFFEKLVVELLVAMGYGGSRADAGKAIGGSGDGGVDGVISEDRLGLDAIYVQAKKYTDRVVQRPEVQGFAGSLLAKRGRKGVFITTSRFSDGAREYVREIQSDAKIVLIDGKALARHMVEFGIGVTTERTYTVKRVDSDYFSEE